MEMHGGNLQHSYGLNNVVGAATDAPLRCSGRVAGSLAPPEEASVPYRDARRGATAAAANRAAREAAVEPCVRVGRTNQEGGGRDPARRGGGARRGACARGRVWKNFSYWGEKKKNKREINLLMFSRGFFMRIRFCFFYPSCKFILTCLLFCAKTCDYYSVIKQQQKTKQSNMFSKQLQR